MIDPNLKILSNVSEATNRTSGETAMLQYLRLSPLFPSEKKKAAPSNIPALSSLPWCSNRIVRLSCSDYAPPKIVFDSKQEEIAMEEVEKEEMTFSNSLRVEIPLQTVKDTEMRTNVTGLASQAPTSGLVRQTSAKANCLCSPTTHAGSFRCRLHRSPTLQRTKSATLRESLPKENTESTVEAE